MLCFIKKIFSPPAGFRQWNTNSRGEDFTKEEEQRVWEKGDIVPERSQDETRRDVCGAIIKRDDYGNTSSHYGWEIDHIKPVSSGGGDEVDNLQPLQWRNNRSKSDDYPAEPESYCRVREKLVYNK